MERRGRRVQVLRFGVCVFGLAGSSCGFVIRELVVLFCLQWVLRLVLSGRV